MTVGRGVSQCAEIARIARGIAPIDAAMPRRYDAIASQACGSPGGGSMKKHGPPPCGTNSDGRREVEGVDVAKLFIAHRWRRQPASASRVATTQRASARTTTAATCTESQWKKRPRPFA